MERADLVPLEERFTIEEVDHPTFGVVFIITCKTCGHTFKPRATVADPEKKVAHLLEHVCRES